MTVLNLSGSTKHLGKILVILAVIKLMFNNIREKWHMMAIKFTTTIEGAWEVDRYNFLLAISNK